MSPVRYELGFICPKTTFFIVTAVKTSNLAWFYTSFYVFKEKNTASLHYHKI
jgi:hypothetical protein